MEEVSAAVAGRASNAEASQHIHSLRSPSKHTTSKNHLTRSRSVIDLAINFFKTSRFDEVETGTPKHEKQERVIGLWNPFPSLQKKTTGFATARSKSFSPQKKGDLGVDEFGRQKAMRRKSLQDLLGTVGSKFTLSRRWAPGEDILPQYESSSDSPYEEFTESDEISPLVLPEPAIPLSGSSNALLDSLYLYSKDLQLRTVPLSQNKHAVQRESEEIPSHRVKPGLDSPVGAPIAVVQASNVLENSSVPGLHCHSQDRKCPSPLVSPERLCPTVPTDFLRDVSPHVSAHIRFADEEELPQYRYSKDFEDRNASDYAGLDPLFPARLLSREARHNSPTKDVEGHIALIAAKMSKNRHYSTNRSTWSEDSSETETDDMLGYDCVEKEMEVQDVINRGKDIMELRRLSPYLHSRATNQSQTPLRKDCSNATDPAPEETGSAETLENIRPVDALSPVQRVAPLHHEESLASEHRCTKSEEDRTSPAPYVMPAMPSRELELERPRDLALSDGRLQNLDEVSTQVNCRANQEGTATILLKAAERFRPRRANSRMVSTELVHVYYPPNEFYAAYTRTYGSKSEAIGDLYQNNDGFSDYCFFDRKTRTFYPKERSEPRQDSLQSNDEKLEVLWLPLEMFPADAPINRVDRANSEFDGFKGYVTGLKRLPPSAEFYAPTSNSKFILIPADKNSDVKASDGIKDQFSRSTDDDDAYFEYGAGAGYSHSSPHADGLAESNHRLTMIKTREVAGSTTKELVPEGLISNPDDMDDSYDIDIDSTTARLYLGSLFSSTESIRPIKKAGVNRPDSVNSIWSKLIDAQPEEATQVKTWIELEHDLGRYAVSEAFKKLNGCVESLDNDETFISDDSDPSFQDASSTENEQWLRYGEAYDGAMFEYVEDITKYERIREELTVASSLYIRGDSPRTLTDGPSTKFDADGKGKETANLSENFRVSSIELATARVHSEENHLEQKGADRKMISTDLVMFRRNAEESGSELCWNPEMGNLGNNHTNGSRESSRTEDTAVTMPTGCKFTKYPEQLLEGPEGARSEVLMPCESESGDQGIRPGSGIPMDPVSNFLVLTDVCKPNSSNELAEMNREASSKVEMLDLKENRKLGLAITMTDQVMPPPSSVGLPSPRHKHFTSSNSGPPTYADALSNLIPSTPHLQTHKRVLAPGKRMTNPLTELSPPQSPAAQRTSAPPSEADTEASEDFGLKLQRYSRTGEDSKENEDRW